MEIIGIILGILGIAQGGYQIALNEIAPHFQGRIKAIAKQIQQKISENSALAERLAIAYNQKNGQMLNSLLTGMGFGNRINALQKAIEKNDSDYKQSTSEINKTNAKLNKINTELEAAQQQAGQSIHGAIKANEAADAASRDIKDIKISQNVNGGIEN